MDTPRSTHDKCDNILKSRDPYFVLGLPPGASEDEIRAVHRELVKKHHPDGGGSNQLLSHINAARDFLLTGGKRDSNFDSPKITRIDTAAPRYTDTRQQEQRGFRSKSFVNMRAETNNLRTKIRLEGLHIRDLMLALSDLLLKLDRSKTQYYPGEDALLRKSIFETLDIKFTELLRADMPLRDILDSLVGIVFPGTEHLADHKKEGRRSILSSMWRFRNMLLGIPSVNKKEMSMLLAHVIHKFVIPDFKREIEIELRDLVTADYFFDIAYLLGSEIDWLSPAAKKELEAHFVGANDRAMDLLQKKEEIMKLYGEDAPVAIDGASAMKCSSLVYLEGVFGNLKEDVRYAWFFEKSNFHKLRIVVDSDSRAQLSLDVKSSNTYVVRSALASLKSDLTECLKRLSDHLGEVCPSAEVAKEKLNALRAAFKRSYDIEIDDIDKLSSSKNAQDAIRILTYLYRHAQAAIFPNPISDKEVTKIRLLQRPNYFMTNFQFIPRRIYRMNGDSRRGLRHVRQNGGVLETYFGVDKAKLSDMLGVGIPD